MHLTTHAAVGILAATKTANPWWAFILSFILHFVLDLIPHGDESILDKNRPLAGQYKRILSFSGSDFIILISYTYFILTKIDTDPVIIFSAVLGSVLPDVLWILQDITHSKILKPFNQIHKLFHNPLKIKLKPATGVALAIGGPSRS